MRDPQPLRIVFHDRAHAIVAERARVCSHRAERLDLVRLRIQTMQAAIERADPERARMILANGAHARALEPRAPECDVVDEIIGRRLVAAQARHRCRPRGAQPDRDEARTPRRTASEHALSASMTKVTYAAGLRIEHIETVPLRAGPDRALGVDRAACVWRRSRDVLGSAGSWRNCWKRSLRRSQRATPPPIGREPQIAARVLGDLPDVIARQRRAHCRARGDIRESSSRRSDRGRSRSPSHRKPCESCRMLITVLCDSPSRMERCSKYIGRTSGTGARANAERSSARACERKQRRTLCARLRTAHLLIPVCRARR